MTTSNDDLDLQALWQDSPAPDVDALLVYVRKSRKRMWQILAIEVISTIGVMLMLAIYTLWGVFGDNLWPPAVLAVCSVAFQAWTWRWRRGLWRSVSDAPLDLLRLQRKRTRLNLKIARYYLWGSPIGVLVGIAFASWTVDDEFSTGLSVPWRLALLTAVGLLVALTLIYGWRMASRCKRELTIIDGRIAELEEDAN